VRRAELRYPSSATRSRASKSATWMCRCRTLTIPPPRSSTGAIGSSEALSDRGYANF
jgi:hypothetical protein